MSRKEVAPTAYTNTPDSVDAIYQERLAQGYEPRGVVIRPVRPVVRGMRYHPSGARDYFSQELAYSTQEETDYAQLYLRVIGRLIKLHGSQNVKTDCLPADFPANPNYPSRVQRLVMVRTSPSGWQIEAAVSSNPRSPSEAIARAEQEPLH